MGTTDRAETTVSPEDCELGSLTWDIGRNRPGIVMGHVGGDRVQLRPPTGGLEWDAFKLRPLTASEELTARNNARNAMTRMGL
jgi:hypothetical protein